MQSKTSKQALVLLSILMILLTLSCNLLPGKTGPGDNNPAPPPIEAASTATLPAITESNTDANGNAVLRMQDTSTEITVSVVDQKDNQPLENIQVSYVSNGGKTLVIAIDPTGKYLSTANEVPLGSSVIEEKQGLAKYRAANQHVSLAVVIVLISALEVFQNGEKWVSFIANIPEIQNWSKETTEICLNPEQTKEGIEALAGTGGILLSAVGDTFGVLTGDILVDGLKLVAGNLLEESLTDQINQNIDQQAPKIVKWKIYKINDSIPYFVRPEGYCLTPRDKFSLDSTIEWVKYGVEHDDLYVMDVVSADEITYIYYIEGGDDNDKQEFLDDLKEREASEPTCAGIKDHDGTTPSIWFENWEPLWEIHEMCYNGCWSLDVPGTSNIVGFYLKNYDDNGFQIQAAWVDSYDIFTDVYRNIVQPCTVSTEEKSIESTGITSCPNAPVQRMKVGKNGYVCTKEDGVYLKSAASLSSTRLRLIEKGTVFSVIGGPKCANNWSFWQIQLSSGTIGWISEGGDAEDPYFICPKE